MGNYVITHLRELESEAIFIIREIAAQFENPVLLFSGGKDSILLTHLAKKAFYPAKIPFPLIHIDTGHNFPETIEFRDNLANNLDLQLIVGSVQEAIDKGRVKEETGANASRNSLQIVSLLDTLEEHKADAALGGARRDEEKARAKERFFSHRDEFGQWDPKNQRPELWDLFNTHIDTGEHIRVFPISNWTEMDVWHYIMIEELELPSIYFTHEREVFSKNNLLVPVTEYTQPPSDVTVEKRNVRFRTVGDISCTCPVLSSAKNPEEIILETASSSLSERGATRLDDQTNEASMERRKKEGYF